MQSETVIPEQINGPAEPAGVEPVVPAGADPLDDLTAAELSIASRRLGCDVYDAVGDTRNGAGRRWDALPLLAWLWAKRRDPAAKLEPFTQLRTSELNHALRLDEDDDDDQVDDVDADPTAPGRAS